MPATVLARNALRLCLLIRLLAANCRLLLLRQIRPRRRRSRRATLAKESNDCHVLVEIVEMKLFVLFVWFPSVTLVAITHVIVIEFSFVQTNCLASK